MRIGIASAALLMLAAQPSLAEGSKAPAPGQGQVVELSVTNQGFVPAQVTVKAGKAVTLVVTRKTERTCATEIVLPDYDIKKALPLNQPVTVTFTPKKSGTIRYSCAMGMIGGVLEVK